MFEHEPRPAEPTQSKPADGRLDSAALFGLAVLAVVWGWWAWQEGAWFGVVLLPGAIVLCLATALLAGFAPSSGRLALSRPTAVALGALVALGVWTALSALWSPAPDLAIADGQRALVYALAFGLGMWTCNLLGPRMELAMIPLAAGAGFAGVATIVALVGASNPTDLLEVDGTLDYPIGYRNANAAFFAIALFPAIGLATNGRVDWRARALALGVATLCIELFALSQSRASLPAILIALLIYALAAPVRLRAICWLALAVLPALAIAPALLELYSAANDEGVRSAADELRAAGWMAAFSAAAAVVLGGLAARYEGRIPLLSGRGTAANRAVGWALAGVVAAGAVGFVAAVGDPVEWLDERAEEFRSAGSPDLGEEASRFTFNAGSDRYDFWRVALDRTAADPLFGDGAGGYQYAYTREREVVDQYARDAHSVELELLAELGVPGLALFATAAVAAVLAMRRARRLGPSASALVAVALAAGAYWIMHASVDWFWPYPAVTAPVLALVGAACAPTVLAIGAPRRRVWRRWLIAAVAVLAVSAVPPWLSERYVNDAYEDWGSDIDRAYDDLDAARALNPLSDAPLLAEASIARASGDTGRAIASFREVVAKRPEEWASHYLLAKHYARDDPRLARNEALVALELNPLDPRTRALARRLDARLRDDRGSP
jgi:hypothetical protein